MLTIGRALMTNPERLILDEATDGLAPAARQETGSAISRLKPETGLANLVIDTSSHELAGVAHSATILETGRTLWLGGFSALTSETTERYRGV